MQNDLWYLLSPEQRETIYKEARDLKEDIIYLSIMLERNKKSNFSFRISPFSGMKTRFLPFLWNNMYKKDLEDFYVMLTDFHVAEMLFDSLYNDDNCFVITRSDEETIVKHFLERREMDLSEYVGDFIGCSRGCSHVAGKIKKIEERMSR